MKKIAYISGIFALLLSASFAPAANAQTYVYSNGSQSCSNITQYLAFGSTDSYTSGQVSTLQRFLNTAGFLSGVSGYFDAGTRSAVMTYQRTHGISQTGTVGPLTRSSINQMGCSNVSYGNNYQNNQPNNCYVNANVYQCGCANTNGTNGYNYNNGYTSNGNYNVGYNNTNCGNTNYNTVFLNSLSQTSGSPGQTITLYGSGFSNVNTVYFGGVTLQNIYSNGNSLTVTVPTGLSYGSYSISVSNGYTSSSNSLTFSINSTWNTTNYNNNSNYNGTWYGGGNQPSISAITGQTNVNAGSSNTWSANAYDQNGLPLIVRADWGDGTSDQGSQTYQSYGQLNGSNQQYSFQHNYQNSGTYTLRFTATDSNGAYSYSTMQVNVTGNNNSYNNNYYYNNGTPTISSVSQSYVRAGNTITIYGSNFANNATVLFGSNNSYGTTAYSNGNSISFTVPNSYAGTYTLSVRNPNGSTSNTTTITIW